MSIIIGTMTNGASISTDMIPFEVDDVAPNEFKRFEDTTEKQLIIKTEVDGSITRKTYTIDLWSNRATATYKPINQ